LWKRVEKEIALAKFEELNVWVLDPTRAPSSSTSAKAAGWIRTQAKMLTSAA